MKKQLDKVDEFHKAFGLHKESKPTLNVPSDIRKIWVKLMKEEVSEVEYAMEHEKIEDLAKELGDVLYVLLGTVKVFGLASVFEEVFDAVHSSNMSKLDEKGQPIFTPDGRKVAKSALYKKPDIASILEKRR